MPPMLFSSLQENVSRPHKMSRSCRQPGVRCPNILPKNTDTLYLSLSEGKNKSDEIEVDFLWHQLRIIQYAALQE